MIGIPYVTRTGPIDLAALRPEDMAADRIGEALSKINRFGGRTPEPFSIAAHSVLVEALCPSDLRPWALLHDAHAAFLGDITTPALELMCQSGTRSAVEHAVYNARSNLDRSIAKAWGTPLRSMNAHLREADMIAFVAEAWVFLNARPERLHPSETDLLDRAIALLRDLPTGDWRAACALWIDRTRHYAGLGLLTPPKATDPTSAVLAG